MKIVCLIRSLTLGGAERQIVGLASELSKAGHDVKLLSYHRENYYDVKDSGVECVFLKKGATSLGFSFRLAAYVRENGIQLVIAFLPGPCKKACVAHLIYPHFRLIVSERNFNLFLWPHDFIRFNLFRQADKVISNSHAQEAFLRSHASWLDGKLGTIVNFAPVESLLPSNDKQEGASTVKVVVTARLCPRKCPIALIKAAALLEDRNYRFVVKWYGAVDSVFGRYCQRLVDRLGLAKTVLLLPPEKDIAGIYREADIFCLPSRYEGTSNSLAEAMCCGLPVVCTEVSDSPLYVKDGVNGFLCRRRSVESLADALGKALSLSAEERRRFGRESRRIAVENFASDQFGDQWREEVEKL